MSSPKSPTRQQPAHPRALLACTITSVVTFPLLIVAMIVFPSARTLWFALPFTAHWSHTGLRILATGECGASMFSCAADMFRGKVEAKAGEVTSGKNKK